MKPLQSIAMGLVIIVLTARARGFDVLADPAGWLLVGLGVRGLPGSAPGRTLLQGLAAVAGATSVVLWFVVVPDDASTTVHSLVWAASLPQLAFSVVACHVLADRAAESGDRRAAAWLRITRGALVVVGLLPVLVFGAGLTDLEVGAYVAAGLSAVLLIWLLFAYASRPWAGCPIGETPASSTPTS